MHVRRTVAIASIVVHIVLMGVKKYIQRQDAVRPRSGVVDMAVSSSGGPAVLVLALLIWPFREGLAAVLLSSYRIHAWHITVCITSVKTQCVREMALLKWYYRING
jgi:hypothetical protein